MDLCLVIGEKGGNSSWLKSNSRSILATKSQDLLIKTDLFWIPAPKATNYRIPRPKKSFFFRYQPQNDIPARPPLKKCIFGWGNAKNSRRAKYA